MTACQVINQGKYVLERESAFEKMTKCEAMPRNKIAVIYGRVSSEDQVQGYSLEAQLKACREWAEKNGHKVVREYVEAFCFP